MTVAKARHTVLILLALASVPVIAAGIAWACSPSAGIALTPMGGSSIVNAGDPMLVHGTNLTEGNTTVHWESADGPLIGEGEVTQEGAGRVEIPITIPVETGNGTHTVVAVASDPRYTASVNLIVGPPDQADNPGAKTPSGSPTGGGKVVQSPGSSDESGSGRNNATTDGGARRGGRQVTRRQVSGGERGAAPRRGSARFPESQFPAARGNPDQRQAAAPGVPGTPSGRTVVDQKTVFSDSIAPSRDGRADGGRDAVAPSAATAPRDRWSGFRSDTKPSLTSSGPSDEPPARSLSLGMQIGAGLLGTGLIVLFGGSLIAVSRRRRAHSVSRRTTSV